MYANYPDLNGQRKSTSHREPPIAKPSQTQSVQTSAKRGGLFSDLLAGFGWDDLILIAVILLLLSEKREEDPSLLIILAILFFS